MCRSFRDNRKWVTSAFDLSATTEVENQILNLDFFFGKSSEYKRKQDAFLPFSANIYFKKYYLSYLSYDY